MTDKHHTENNPATQVTRDRGPPLVSGGTTIHLGDCREILRTLPSNSINCCVTSPPYFGLRDYGHGQQIGMETTPDTFVAELVSVFREVHRVLRDDGTLWLNLGDSYVATATSSAGQNSQLEGGRRTQKEATKRPSKTGFGIKPKNLIGIPWRVAFALQSDGWYLRQDIIWHKPNPMPESVRDRCTKAHEYVFLLSKSERYYFDADAIAEPLAESSIKRLSQATLEQQRGSNRVPGKSNGTMKAVGSTEDGKRNRRSVWTVPTQPFKGAHFATFPPNLVEPCILAGCPEGGTMLDPFFGAGTTGLVAAANNRKCIGIELNSEYRDMAFRRLRGEKITAQQPTEVPEVGPAEVVQQLNMF